MNHLSGGLKYVIIVLLGFCMSCTSEKLHQYSENDVFRYNEISDIKTLDPAFAKNQAHIWVCNQMYNSLVQLNTQLEVIPSIAKSWHIDSTAKVYTFELRNDVQFHHPEIEGAYTLTADDVVFSLERLRSATLAAPGAWILDRVAENGIKKLNNYKIEITLEDPEPSFLSLLSMQYASILSKAYYSKTKEDYFIKPLGTGPFYFKFWEDKVKLVLRKNIKYFEKDNNGTSLPYLEAISIRFLPDKHSAFLEFIKGNLDFVSGIDASYKDQVLDKNGNLKKEYEANINLLQQDYLNTEYLAFLVDSNAVYPYNNVFFRRAVNFAFDRQLMMKYIRNNIGQPAEYGFIPKGLPAFEKDKKYYFFNMDSVQMNLNKSGYLENGSPEIELHTNTSYLDLCEFIQNSLGKYGIKVKVTVHPSSTLRQLISKQKVQFFRASWIADYPDAENYLSLFYGENKAPNGPNYSHFQSSEFDAIYKQTKQIGEHKERIMPYRKLQNIMLAKSPVVPLYYDEVFLFLRKNIKGLETNPMNLIHLKNVTKK
ncbi:MAG: ABC transporter substrate-binding protein [Flavobacteriales bacterium]